MGAWDNVNGYFCKQALSLTHHTASEDRLPRPTLAKGGPLSDLMARGSQYSLKARSRTRRTSGPLGLISPLQTNRYREAASCTVRGSILTPFPVRNHPLRSMDHTSLGLSAAANGSLQGEALLRRFRRRTSPARSRMSPAVLGAGHDSPGSTSRSHATSFLGPQVGCSRLAVVSRSATAREVLLGWLCGARLRSPSPTFGIVLLNPSSHLARCAHPHSNSPPARGREQIPRPTNRNLGEGMSVPATSTTQGCL